MTPTELAGIIRFYLGELAARNGHHEFEHLSRYLCRARVYSNVLPATGPVGAGGDQGRDFETFKSRTSLPAIKGFSDRVSRDEVAFACSLDKRIVEKIRKDVRTICNAGPVPEIVYFCEANVTVGIRHRLQHWAKTTHDVDLQIFDGTAISELLADRDVFWIAQAYLHLPAEIMPTPLDQDGWHATHLERWSARRPIVFSDSDFQEVKFGLRRATFDEDARPHLLFWIRLMECFLHQPAPRTLQRSAAYEVAVANLRGKGDMTSELERIRDFYSDLEDWLSIADLKDAATLLSYSFGGIGLSRFAADLSELQAWRRRLSGLLNREIQTTAAHGRRSGLFEVRAQTRLLPDDDGIAMSTDQVFDDWTSMLGEAELAPLFPIGDFAAHLSALTPLFGTHPRFDAIGERVDALLAKRQGPATAARNTFERAMVFYKEDRLTEAIRDLHRVQLRWFTGDTIVDFQRATLLLSDAYLELGFAYAAKNMALAGAYVARYSDDPEVMHTLPRMLFAVANADDGAGNSLSYFRLLLLALDAHARLEPDPLHADKHPNLNVDFSQMAALRGLAIRMGSAWLEAVDQTLEDWPGSLRGEIVKGSRDPSGFWSSGSWDDVWTSFEENFIDVPFGDAGPTRSVKWRALGIGWTAAFDQEGPTTPVAEEFIAALQIATVTLSEVDLCTLPLSIHLRLLVQADAGETEMLDVSKCDEVVRLTVKLASANPGTTVRDHVSSILAIVAALLAETSVLPHDDLTRILQENLILAADRLYVVRPYHELFSEFVPPEPLSKARLDRTDSPFDGREFIGWEHPLLAAKSGPGPTYSKAEALKRIGIRYERGPVSVGLTIRRLLEDESRRSFLRGWHDDGLKDWEVMSVIANAAANIRHPLSEERPPTAEEMQALYGALDVAEDLALDPALFTDEMLRLTRMSFHGALLRSWGLKPLSEVPAPLVEAFLAERYGLRTDDIDHVDLFDRSANLKSGPR
jgi:hypothetical protein